MKVAKEFKWEMAHRLQFHSGRCRNLHGHSYKAIITFEGDLQSNGMLIDFYEIFTIVHPIIDRLDHSIICDVNDNELIEIAKKINERYVIIDKPTTAENISIYLTEEIIKKGLPDHIHVITTQVFETEDACSIYSFRIK